MNYDVELAKEFKNRDNENYFGIMVGTVASTSPITVTINGGKALFTGNNLYVCKNATEYQIPFSLTGYDGAAITGTITHEGLKKDDRVAVIATEDNQKMFVIDKLT